MKALVAPLIALVVLAIVAAADWAHYTPLLPPRVASHIGPSGQVDRWADKAEFLEGSLGWVKTVPPLFLGLGILSALAIRFLPEWAVNLPNKGYWLATPERRTEAAILSLSLFLWFLFALLAMLFFGVMHSMFVATLHPDGRGDYLTLPVVAGGLILMAVRAVLFIRRLNNPPRAGRGAARRSARATPHDS